MKKATVVATLIDINHTSKRGKIEQRHIDKCRVEIEWATKNKLLTQTGEAQWELTPTGSDWCNIVGETRYDENITIQDLNIAQLIGYSECLEELFYQAQS